MIDASLTCDKGQTLSAAELSCLVELRDQQIRALKFELEKYKLALHQSQLDYHYIQRQLISQQRSNQQLETTTSTKDNEFTTDDNIDNILAEAASTRERESLSEIGTLIADDDEDVVATIPRRRLASLGQDPGEKQASMRFRQEQPNKVVANPIGRPSNASASDTSNKVVFKAGAEDDDDDEEDNLDDIKQDFIESNISLDDDDDADIDDIIPDVGEIDLNLEIEDIADSNNQKRKTTTSCKQNSVQVQNKDLKTNDDDNRQDTKDEDIISDGLLTSLTDAAISNLSQLAALQERCESQQHPHQQYQQRSQQHQHKQPSAKTNQPRQQQEVSLDPARTRQTSITASTSPSLLPVGPVNQPYGPCSEFPIHDSFTNSVLANNQAIAPGTSVVPPLNSTASVMIAPVITSSSSSSISPPDSIQADLNSSHSLASVVAAAAVAAAAAANDQHHHNHHPHHQPQLQHHDSVVQQQTARLISSALPSPEFYHNLHHQHAQNHLHMLTSQQQPSPVSSIHFSPSTSITPSSSSLLAHSRRSASNASSSLLSPITSPNYLRRQFMPDRMPIMSPSPTSGITTGSSSAASTSFAHILHHQQRSASALGGPIVSASSTPLSSSGSTAVSPMMSNKNSLARLNTMQIRHKFGYLGSGRGQFNSPHGFCLGLNQEIVVADTNNHRVCIFDKSGTYLTQFGSPGKEEGQLWNPRKVAILNRPIGNHQSLQHYSGKSGGGTGSDPLYVVCDRGAERSRMQLFTKDGAFIKKIGIHYIDIVAGLAITQNGLIIVVDSVSPTVYIINGETGILNGWFDCSGHMKEPSDIAVKSDVHGNEYFICDFKGHCVVVFSEQGEYLRKIGHDGLTSYPNGIDISDDGDILVGDSHGNRFHVVVFDRNGKLFLSLVQSI